MAKKYCVRIVYGVNSRVRIVKRGERKNDWKQFQNDFQFEIWILSRWWCRPLGCLHTKITRIMKLTPQKSHIIYTKCIQLKFIMKKIANITIFDIYLVHEGVFVCSSALNSIILSNSFLWYWQFTFFLFLFQLRKYQFGFNVLRSLLAFSFNWFWWAQQ